MTSSLLNNAWLRYPKPNPQSRLRLFCFPYAGGGATVFRSWADGLPAEVELCSIELPGRGARLREPPFTQLSPLVQAISQVLLPHLDKPFAFLGYSMGALVSFELARQLRRDINLRPAQLFVCGCRAPQLSDPAPPIHHLPTFAFVEELRRLNGTPDEVSQNAELMRLFLPTLRADITICETYVYAIEDPLDCPISAFGGLQDRKVSQADLAAWRDQTRSTFNLRMFSGDHFFLKNSRAFLTQAVYQELVWLLDRTTGGQQP